MNGKSKLVDIIGQPESDYLEYKAVLPPSTTIARLIAGFANSKGGFLVLGVDDSRNGKINILGLSDDFRATEVTNKALSQLSPVPVVAIGYHIVNNEKLFVVEVERSKTQVEFEGRIFVRKGVQTIELNAPKNISTSAKPIADLMLKIEGLTNFSGSMARFLEHYKSILNIIADLPSILYPVGTDIATTNAEGIILTRILFSSCADNFEGYLSDLLYEIFLAQPNTLKSQQPVSVKEVLDCVDMQDFIQFVAKKKLSKLQRGSVKGFISENAQIADLKVLDNTAQEKLEGIMQIRHLYSHRNGVVDDKFMNYFPGQFLLHEVHSLSIIEFLCNLEYLVDSVTKIDTAAINKYSLATIRI